jgi:nucleotide-binding universal stress UspA family protein
MKTEKILLPIDIRKCPLEAFSFVDRLAAHCDTSIILLHVITLNILTPESRLHVELAAEARFYLECLAREYLPDVASTSIRIRYGNFADEVVSQANAENVDFIILPNDCSSFLARLRRLWQPEPHSAPLVKKVVAKANSGVVVVAARNHFDCEKVWGRPSQHMLKADQGLAQLVRPPGTAGAAGRPRTLRLKLS